MIQPLLLCYSFIQRIERGFMEKACYGINYSCWCHENGSFSALSFNQHYLSIPQYRVAGETVFSKHTVAWDTVFSKQR